MNSCSKRALFMSLFTGHFLGYPSFKNHFIYSVCLYVYEGYTHAITYVWRLEGNFQRSFLSVYHWVLELKLKSLGLVPIAFTN